MISEIAKKARIALENFREAGPQTWPLDMEGLCAHGALKVFYMLKKKGYSPKLVVWNEAGDSAELGGHCYVECDGFIVDITATQFGLSKTILITNIKDRKNHEFWESPTFSTDDPESFIDHLLGTDWDVHQIPPLYF